MLSWGTFSFEDAATTVIYTLSLHDALPIFMQSPAYVKVNGRPLFFIFDLTKYSIDWNRARSQLNGNPMLMFRNSGRSEEHTSELQSRRDLVCRLLLEKKNTYNHTCSTGQPR